MGLKGSLFMSPERVIFGCGVVKDTGTYTRQMGGKKVFLVADDIIANIEAFQTILKSLKDEGIDYYLYTESDVNPTDVQIDKGCAIYKEEGCDVIIGVGGGSNLDTAKSIGIVATNKGSIRDNFVLNYVTDPYDTPNKNPIPPTILIPTTAGTGSEVGAWTVVTNTAENYKGFCGGWMCLPKIALLDPEMTVSMPSGLTASTGYDALIHGLEAYYHRYKMPQTDMYALTAIKRIFKYLGRAVANGNDMEAREQMLLGAMEAGFAMNTGCALIHSSGLQLTSKFGLSHGETLAIMTGPVMRFNTMACTERMIDVAEAMGENIQGLGKLDAAYKAADAMEKFAQSIGLPTSLDKELHDPSKIPAMAKTTLENDNTYGNPRVPTQEGLEELYRQAYGETLDLGAQKKNYWEAVKKKMNNKLDTKQNFARDIKRQLIRVDMTKGSVNIEDADLQYPKTGGRSLTSAVIAGEVSPHSHALGAENKMVIAPGLLSGTSCPNSGRLSIGAKSPLTGTIKESNVGGTAALFLGKMRIGGVVIEGQPMEDRLYTLVLNKNGGKLLPADTLKGLGNYALVEKLQGQFGKKVSIISIGQAGENKLSNATVAVTDPDGRPCRHAGRGGVGAVMGSKGIKAIVVDPAGAPGLEIFDKDAFKKSAKVLKTMLVESEYTAPKTGEYAKYGMNLIMDPVNDLGALPSYNYRQGQFEGVKKINGEALYNTIKKRGGKYNHSGCSTCIIQCSNVYVDEKGEYVTSSLEYETLFALGSNCGIDDLDALARMDRMCDDYGIDTMETGCAIAVAMEGKVKAFGDAQGAIELIEAIGNNTPMGRILGSGTEMTGKVFGVERVPVVKGQSMAGYDPRVIKGLGVTYATSTMGADHTSGFAAVFTEEDRNPEGKARFSKDCQNLIGFIDTVGICFAVIDVANTDNGGVESMVDMVNAVYDWNMTMDDMVACGKEVLRMEKEFNAKAGFSSKNDRLPEFMHTEKVGPNNTVFDVPYNEIDAVFAN